MGRRHPEDLAAVEYDLIKPEKNQMTQTSCSGETETQRRAEGLPEDTQPQWWSALIMEC